MLTNPVNLVGRFVCLKNGNVTSLGLVIIFHNKIRRLRINNNEYNVYLIQRKNKLQQLLQLMLQLAGKHLILCLLNTQEWIQPIAYCIAF